MAKAPDAVLKPQGVYNITDEFLDMIKLPEKDGKKLNYLIVMPSQAEEGFQYYFPAGMGIVSSALKASGRNVYTLNLTYKKNPAELLAETIKKHNIDAVFTGGLSGQFSTLKQIADTAKETNPKIITAVGGGIITADPNIAMEALKNADYGMAGEGEITVNDLAYALEQDIDPSQFPGIIKKGSEDFIPRAEIMNLDCLPFPDYEGFEYAESFKQKYSATSIKNASGAVITTSRSCPYNCTFCFHSSGKKYRRRSLDSVFEEIALIRRLFRFDYLQISDELFGTDIEYVREFAERIKPYGIAYLINTRLDRITDELLQILSDSGCTEILFGIEHVDDKILKSMNKKTKAEIIAPTLKKCRDYGITPIGNIILGDVAETEETVAEALEWWRYNHGLGSITTTYLIVFPGSAIYKAALKKGVIKDPAGFLKAGCPLINVTEMSDEKWELQKDKVAEYRILYEKDAELDASALSAKLDAAADCYKCCIWPATVDSIRLFKNLSPKFFKNAKLININPDTQMLRGAGNIEVYTPDIIAREGIEVVVCPRETLKESITEICKNKYPSVKYILTASDIQNAEKEVLN